MPTTRTTPAHTKLVICVWHPFTFWRPQPVLPEALRRRWPEMRVLHLPDYDHLPQELPDTDIFVGYSLRPQQLKLAKNLKWLHSTAAGVAQLMYTELRDSGIVVTNPSGIFSVPMAEHTMGLLIALARNFPDSVRYQDNSRWGQQDLWDLPQRLTELNGQLLLIVGYARSAANSPAAPTPSISAFGASPVPEKAILPMPRGLFPSRSWMKSCRKPITS